MSPLTSGIGCCPRTNTGDSAIIPAEFIPSIAGFDMVLRCHSALPQFIQFALLSSYLKDRQIDLEKMRAAQPHLNAQELGSCLVVLPHRDEQDEITAFLERETAKLDTLTAEAERAIELLQERRTALISAAVIGQNVAHVSSTQTKAFIVARKNDRRQKVPSIQSLEVRRPSWFNSCSPQSRSAGLSRTSRKSVATGSTSGKFGATAWPSHTGPMDRAERD